VTAKFVPGFACNEHSHNLSKCVWGITHVADKARESRQYYNYDDSDAFNGGAIISGSGTKNQVQVESGSIIRAVQIEAVMPN